MVGLTALPKDRQRGCYEQIIGGRLREVRSNVTRPADETNLAVVGLVTMSLPSWKGLPQPAGEFPLPSDNGCVARQNVPSIFAHSMPQCVYSRYGRPASSRVVVVDEPVCEPHAATAMAAPTRARRRIVICSHYERTASSSHLAGDQHHLLGPALALIARSRSAWLRRLSCPIDVRCLRRYERPLSDSLFARPRSALAARCLEMALVRLRPGRRRPRRLRH